MNKSLEEMIRADAPKASMVLESRVREIANKEVPSKLDWKKWLPLNRRRSLPRNFAIAGATLLVAVVGVAVISSALRVEVRGGCGAAHTIWRWDRENFNASNCLDSSNYGSSSGSSTSAQTVAPRSSATPAIQSDSLNGVPVNPTRVQEITSDFTIKVTNPQEGSKALIKAMEMAREMGGYVVSSQAQTKGDHFSSTILIRVPVARQSEAMIRVSKLGQVIAQSITLADRTQISGNQSVEIKTLKVKIFQLEQQIASLKIGSKAWRELHQEQQSLMQQLAADESTQQNTKETTLYAALSITLTDHIPSAPKGKPSHFHLEMSRIWSLIQGEVFLLLSLIGILALPLVLMGAVALGYKKYRKAQEARFLDRN
jgi:hypothetical protein